MIRPFTARLALVLFTLGAAVPSLAADEPAAAPTDKVASRYTFSWPIGPGAPAPRGGTTTGPALKIENGASEEWTRLQAAGLSAFERDRRAILAMAGSYRVNFDFLEIAAFTGDGSRPRPYQSWGTEKVFVDEDAGKTIRLVHILEMRIVDKEGKLSEPMVTKHWRQDWHYEPGYIVESQGKETWKRRSVSRSDARGTWSQTVYQVDESPRYASLGRWEHNAAFSSWISGDTARPLPRREWSVRKDYDFLWGTNRHTVVANGWIQEENNLKATGTPGESKTGSPPYVGREYGVARYERIAPSEFTASDAYYQSTRVFWNEVIATWERTWRNHSQISMHAASDQSGSFAQLFDLAEQFSQQKLTTADLKPAIAKSLRSMGVPVGE
ncbi:MAG: DUF6607 family protein [Steroidobacteraceae bacterium]